MQTRIGSLVESLLGTAIGFVIAAISQAIILPIYGIHISLSVNLEITLWFTLISIARSYVLRRLFNKKVKLNDTSC